MTDHPEPATGKQGDKEWAMYYNGFSEEEIAAWFEEKYGYPPDEIKFTGGGALAGPIHKDAVKRVFGVNDADE